MKTKKENRLYLSISVKMILLIVCCVVALSLSFVLIISRFMDTILNRNATSQMNMYCAERGADINMELMRIEDAVHALYGWTTSRIPRPDEVSRNRWLRASLLSDAKELIHFTTEDNEFIQSVYIHYTLDVTGPVDADEGVYYSRGADGTFTAISFTQAEIEKDPVAEYWYYGPIARGEAAWTEPYYDESIGDYLISYIAPVIAGDVPVAILGIDISFSRLIDLVDSFQYHNSGYMYLKAADGSLHYHPKYLHGEDLHGDEVDNAGDNTVLKNPDTGDEIVRYEYRGADRVMTFVTLRNGMKLVLCDAYDEIYSDRNLAIRTLVIVAAVLTLVFGLIMTIIATKVVTGPIRKLTAAANRIGEGDYDVALSVETNDEIGELTRDFNLAISKVRQRNMDMEAHVEEQDRQLEKDAEDLKKLDTDLLEMKNLAYVDSLTGVKNKNAYDDTVDFLNGQIEAGTAHFAVVMCDLNYLKQINDNLGHRAGDTALMRTANLLCRIFPLSTVFRIGGDEFVVFPYGVEYERLEERMDMLTKVAERQIQSSDDITKRLSIAVGSAVYKRGEDQSYKDVFDRADAAMYEHKHLIHEHDGIPER